MRNENTHSWFMVFRSERRRYQREMKHTGWSTSSGGGSVGTWTTYLIHFVCTSTAQVRPHVFLHAAGIGPPPDEWGCLVDELTLTSYCVWGCVCSWENYFPNSVRTPVVVLAYHSFNRLLTFLKQVCVFYFFWGVYMHFSYINLTTKSNFINDWQIKNHNW